MSNDPRRGGRGVVGGVQQKFRISPEQPREGRSTIVHIPPPSPSLPSIVSEQCPRWYQLHLSTKWIRGQRQSAKSAISKALKKHTRLGIREQERALQFVHRHWSKQPQSCTDGQWGRCGSLGFQEHGARGGNLLNFDADHHHHTILVMT